MALSSTARAEARFKQLCCLGLGGEVVMPALLAELRSIVASFGASFFFANDQGDLVGIFDENPETPHIVPLYVEEFQGRPDREFNSFKTAMRTERGVHDLQEVLSIDLQSYQRSDLYNLIMRPLRYDGPYLRLIVRDGEHAVGAVLVYRSYGESSFTTGERRRLAALEGFFAHALTDRPKREAPLVESGRRGLIVADAGGRIVYCSAEGRRLLFFATHQRFPPSLAFHRQASLPPALIRVCLDLAGVFVGEASCSAPTYHHRNIWGGFRFQAQWLDGAELAPGLIGIAVTHEEPLPVKLTRRIGELPLSQRQAQVCFLMANGSTNEEIADKLGISKHTVIAHGRWIYNELDVHSRADLVSKLLAT